MLKTCCILALVALASSQDVSNEIEGSGVEGSGAEEFEGSGAGGACPPALDMVFLVDSSGSSRNTFAETIRWLLNLVDLLPLHRGEVHAAAVQYAGTAMPEFALDTYGTHRDVYDHLNGLVFRSGVTRTGAALQRAKIELFRPDRGGRPYASKLVLLFSDGLSLDNPIPVAEELRAAGVSIYVVALAHDAYMPSLRRIVLDSAAPEEFALARIFRADQLDLLSDTLLRDTELSRRCDQSANGRAPLSLGSLASNEVLAQYDDNDLNEIYNELEIDGALPGASTRRTAATRGTASTGRSTTRRATTGRTTTRGTTARRTTTRRLTTTRRPITTRRPTTTRRVTTTRRPTTTRRGPILNRATLPPLHPDIDKDCPVDLLIMLDSSGSVQHEYYVQKDFVEKILEGMSPMYNQRVAIMQFAGEALQKTEFSFDDYKGYDDVHKAFTHVRHFTGTTHIGKALEHAMDLLKNRRSNALNYVLLVSDGYTQDNIVEPAARLRQRYPDVKVYAVGLADDNKRESLQMVTGLKEHVFIGIREADRFRRDMFDELRGCRRR